MNSRVGVVKIVAEDRILNFVYRSENNLEKKGKFCTLIYRVINKLHMSKSVT